MTELRSSVVMIGDKLPQENNLAVQALARLSDLAGPQIEKLDVLIMPLSVAFGEESQRLLHLAQVQNAALQVILLAGENATLFEIQECTQQLPIFAIVSGPQDPLLESATVSALQVARQVRQNRQLESLVREQNERLRNLHRELEDRVTKRQSFLEESLHKLKDANERWQQLLQVTESVQLAESLGEIESSLTTSLRKSLRLDLARIYPHPQDQIFREQQRSQRSHSLYEVSLRPRDDRSPIGSLFFLRSQKEPFRREETDFLQKIGEVISLAIDRLYQFEQNLALREHWQATFNAVSDPVMIINSKYEVLQTNRAFAGLAGSSDLRFCYQILFQRQTPCENCQRGRNFAVENHSQNRNYEVFSQRLHEPTSRDDLYVHQYHDVTQQLTMEQKILEATRLAEMGTIGSSVAHELNNPLGGMLSFTQLILMELPAEHPFYQDLKELETGVRRCRDIVQNLLGFSRSQVTDEKTRIDLRDAVDRAVKILELQSRAAGIDIKVTHPADPVWIEGSGGYLTQSIQNILHHSLQSVLERAKTQKAFRGLIEIQIQRSLDLIEVNILDNGLNAESWSTVGLSAARQILRDHGGILEFLTDKRPFHIAKITFPAKIVTA